MLARLARGRRSRCFASGVAHRPLQAQLLDQALDAGSDEAPGALVLRLFLAPDDFGVGKPRQLVGQRETRERINLLKTQNLDAVFPALFALIQEVVVNRSE